MSKILDRTGTGAALTAAQNDSNLDSLSGINEAQTGTTYTVTIDDQNRTIEFSNVASIAVDLTAIATIVASLHTSDFKVTLKNVGAGVVTVTRGSTDTFDNGSTTQTINRYEAITIQTDSTVAKWNVFNHPKYQTAATAGTVDASKAVVVDANKDITGFRNVTSAGDLTLDCSAAERRFMFDAGTEETYLYGSTNGNVGMFDLTNARLVWAYDPAANTLALARTIPTATITTLTSTTANVTTANVTTANIAGAYTATGTGTYLLQPVETTAKIELSSTLTKKFEYLCTEGGIIYVEYTLLTTNATYTASGRTYVNGAAIGALHTTVSTSAVTFGDLITVVAGDLLQIYAANSHNLTQWTEVDNVAFRVDSTAKATCPLLRSKTY